MKISKYSFFAVFLAFWGFGAFAEVSKGRIFYTWQESRLAKLLTKSDGLDRLKGSKFSRSKNLVGLNGKLYLSDGVIALKEIADSIVNDSRYPVLLEVSVPSESNISSVKSAGYVRAIDTHRTLRNGGTLFVTEFVEGDHPVNGVYLLDSVKGARVRHFNPKNIPQSEWKKLFSSNYKSESNNYLFRSLEAANILDFDDLESILKSKFQWILQRDNSFSPIMPIRVDEYLKETGRGSLESAVRGIPLAARVSLIRKEDFGRDSILLNSVVSDLEKLDSIVPISLSNLSVENRILLMDALFVSSTFRYKNFGIEDIPLWGLSEIAQKIFSNVDIKVLIHAALSIQSQLGRPVDGVHFILESLFDRLVADLTAEDFSKFIDVGVGNIEHRSELLSRFNLVKAKRENLSGQKKCGKFLQ